MSAPGPHGKPRIPGSGAIKGRGSASWVEGRFERRSAQACHDGWDSLREDDPTFQPAPLRTHVTEETARSIISRNQSPDVGFSQSVNPYRGCEHGWTFY